jgi:hypothetical protein
MDSNRDGQDEQDNEELKIDAVSFFFILSIPVNSFFVLN